MGVLSKNAQRSMLLLNDYKGSDGDTARIFRKQMAQLPVVPEIENFSNQISFI